MLVETVSGVPMAVADQNQTGADLRLLRIAPSRLNCLHESGPAREADNLRHRVLGVSQLRRPVGSREQAKRPRVALHRLAQESLRLAAEQIEVGIPAGHRTISFQ